MSKFFSIFALANENDHDWNIFTILGGSRSFQFNGRTLRVKSQKYRFLKING